MTAWLAQDGEIASFATKSQAHRAGRAGGTKYHVVDSEAEAKRIAAAQVAHVDDEQDDASKGGEE